MADIFTKEKRSEIMSGIRCAGTTPERRLYGIVCDILGHKWRVDCNVHSLPGRPDVVVPSLMLVIQADGCFYHFCPKHGHYPKTNARYWVPKLLRNARRDEAFRRKLRSLGFRVWRVWEHDLKRKGIARTYRRLERRILTLKAFRKARGNYRMSGAMKGTAKR